MSSAYTKDTIVSNYNSAKAVITTSDANSLHNYLSSQRTTQSISDIISCERIPILKTTITDYDPNSTSNSVSSSSNDTASYHSLKSMFPDVNSRNHSNFTQKKLRGLQSSTTSSMVSSRGGGSMLFLREMSLMCRNNCELWRTAVATMRHRPTDFKGKYQPKSKSSNYSDFDGRDFLDPEYLKTLPKSTKVSAAVDLLDLQQKPRPDFISSDMARILFKAAFLFDSLELHERSIPIYQQSIDICKSMLCNTNPMASSPLPSEVTTSIRSIVEAYDMPTNMEEFKRKLERNSKLKVQELISSREKHINECIIVEIERHRQLIVVGGLLLMKCYLATNNPSKAATTFSTISSYFNPDNASSERGEALRIAHTYIKSHTTSFPSESTPEHQILSDSPGLLAEQHLIILNELLSHPRVYPTIPTTSGLRKSQSDETTLLEPDVPLWLGIRYAEKCDFKSSLVYYQMIRNGHAEKTSLTDQQLLERYLLRPSPPIPSVIVTSEILPRISPKHHTSARTTLLSNYKPALSSSQPIVSKVPVIMHDWCPETTAINASSEPLDHIGFMGKHESSTTIVYLTPSQGWESSSSYETR